MAQTSNVTQIQSSIIHIYIEENNQNNHHNFLSFPQLKDQIKYHDINNLTNNNKLEREEEENNIESINSNQLIENSLKTIQKIVAIISNK